MGAGAAEDCISVTEEAADIISSSLDLKACYDIYDIEHKGDKLIIGSIVTSSKDLRKNLRQCKKAAVFAATIGHMADAAIKKHTSLSALSGLAVHSAGTDAIEKWCDLLCADIAKAAGGSLCPRFSPGYGDLPLSLQADICNMLNTSRNIGLMLSDSLLMLPTKSVTAIVGIRC